MTLDLRLYALVDPAVAGGRSLPALAALIADSVTLVQLRDKHGSTRVMIEEARDIGSVLKPRGTPLLINDRVDVALAAKADGVHVGWDDIEPADARRLLGPDAIIGLSIKSMKEAAAAPLDLLNYVAIGGVYATSSKDNIAAPIGPGGLREIAAAIRARKPGMPICAISGIDASNASEVVEAGADGVAVISALSMAKDPAVAAKELRNVVDLALAKRGSA